MPGLPRARSLVLALAALGLGCSDDRVVVNLCNDGVIDADQVCLGSPPRAYTIGLDPIALRVADFDDDGLADVLVTGLDAEGVSGELRLSEGVSLGEAIDPGLYGCSAHPVSGDVDGDAFVDLLVATCEPQLLLFHGGPSGRLSGPDVIGLPVIPRIAALVDLEGDGDDDLAVLGDDDALHVLVADAPGIFAAGPATTMGGLGPQGFALVDADSDGLADLVLLSEAGLLYGRGEGGGAFAPPSALGGPAAPIGLSAADIDGDGHIDLLSRDGPEGDLVVLHGDGAGTFTEAARIEIDGALGPMLSADLDGDGDREILAAVADEPAIDVWRSREGGFAPVIRVELPVPADQLGIGDIDGDGAPDLVAATFAERTITVVLADP